MYFDTINTQTYRPRRTTQNNIPSRFQSTPPTPVHHKRKQTNGNIRIGKRPKINPQPKQVASFVRPDLPSSSTTIRYQDMNGSTTRTISTPFQQGGGRGRARDRGNFSDSTRIPFRQRNQNIHVNMGESDHDEYDEQPDLTHRESYSNENDHQTANENDEVLQPQQLLTNDNVNENEEQEEVEAGEQQEADELRVNSNQNNNRQNNRHKQNSNQQFQQLRQ
ncbi:unnamed protein product, partial [Didymodactylos carnosus]